MSLPTKPKVIYNFAFLILEDVTIFAYPNISSPILMKLTYLNNAYHMQLCLTHFFVHWITLTFKTYDLNHTNYAIARTFYVFGTKTIVAMMYIFYPS